MVTLEVDQARTGSHRDRAFVALRDAMPAANLESALRCSARLQGALPHPEHLDRNLVLVAFGGGKDSAYALAFVRAMQLILHRVHGSTFRLRVATNRHAGMPKAVLENIDRTYRALQLDTDPDSELLLVDGDQVGPFDVDTPQRDQVVRRNRLDILMTGHRTFADGRPTFCNACNLSVVNSFGLAASYGEGADVIITGDSEQEQRQYALWVSRLAHRLAPPPATARRGPGIGRLLSHIDRVSQVYFRDIHGPGAAEDVIAQRRVSSDVPERLQFFSIYADTQYAAGDHMEMLTGFLGFQFDDVAFSFTESDCGNPALMAHLRALKCERVFDRSYAEGMSEYVEFAVGLMRKKDYPPELVDLIRGRYSGPGAVDRMRRAADRYALETFGLTEEQLVCMAYSPFADKGAGLERYLRREHPGLADRTEQVHALLAAESGGSRQLAGHLERVSGLELAQLRVLYRGTLRVLVPGRGGAGTEVIDAVLAGDPHKSVIRTRHTKDGPETLEQISGR
jgi:hypothetical protein